MPPIIKSETHLSNWLRIQKKNTWLTVSNIPYYLRIKWCLDKYGTRSYFPNDNYKNNNDYDERFNINKSVMKLLSYIEKTKFLPICTKSKNYK